MDDARWERGLKTLRWPSLFGLLVLGAVVKFVVGGLVTGSWRQDGEDWLIWLGAGLFVMVLFRLLGAALERRHARRTTSEERGAPPPALGGHS